MTIVCLLTVGPNILPIDDTVLRKIKPMGISSTTRRKIWQSLDVLPHGYDLEEDGSEDLLSRSKAEKVSTCPFQGLPQKSCSPTVSSEFWRKGMAVHGNTF